VALPRDRRGLARFARSVSCGSRHAAVVTGDGAVFAWGWGARGQLGQGGDDRASRFAPTRVRIPGGGEATDVACGWWHTCVEARAVKGDGGDGAG
jgi:alpha-tubulin suppressor-like RCC1 family protein